ncbi:MAG: YibE/F family protein [Candidatus Poribacteria bacterium]|nr:YibE/F family protein [Candidatus Poribacteria bacterium]
MNERNLKIFGVLAIIVIVLVLHVKLFQFSEIVQYGELQMLICLGRTINVDTSEAVDQIITFRIISGKFRGETVQVNNIWVGRAYGDRVIRKRDVLFLEIPLRRRDQTTIDQARMLEYFRTPFLLYLAGLLGGLMILVAGMKGVRAILTLFATAFAILYILVPLTVKGFNPIAVSLLVATLLTLSTFVLITGFSFKVISGVLGTLGGLAAVGILSVISRKVMILTGLAQEFGFLELGLALWRTEASHNWDFHGILVAGMILGAVGAMMDVGMSISSSVYEVKAVNPNVTVRQAIRVGLNVGRDIMGTMADTLIFAYLGAHMITMLLPRIDFPEVGKLYPFLRLANDETTAVAIIQAIVGTIGLVLTVPIAAVIAGILTKYRKIDPSTMDEDLPSEEELEELFRTDDPRSKARLAVPIALIVVLVGTQFLYHRINGASATIAEQRYENGEVASFSEYAKGRVIRRLESTRLNEITEHQILEIEMLSGGYKGQRLILRNILNHKLDLLSIPAEPGDIILCRVGGTPDQISLVNIVQEYGRDGYLIWMLGLMLAIIIIVGRIEGIRTACAMVGSGMIIYFFMLPLISQGKNAVVIVTLTSGMIAFVSLVFVIGPGRKTFSAVLGTMGGILVAGLLIMFAQNYLHFSGLENAVSADIIEATRTPPFDFRQVLLAGMLMGLLGVAVDGAIEVASSMEEIRRANPNMATWRLISSGMNVGTDILGTMVNTLVFAYLGVELLFIMAVVAPNVDLFRSPTVELLSIGIASAEIVRLLAGTLGLVLTIPITAIISGFWNPTEKGQA